MTSSSLEQPQYPPASLNQEATTRHESPLQLRLREEGWLEVGQLKGIHGVEGHVKVTTSDAKADWVNTTTPVCLLPENRALMKQYPNGWHCTFAYAETTVPFRARVLLTGYETPEAAKAWCNAQVYVQLAALPAIEEPDTFRTHQLMGLAIHSAAQQEPFGHVTAIISDKANPAGDVFVEVRLNVSHKDVLIPFQAHFIQEVDLRGNRLMIQGLDDFLISQNQPVPYRQKAMTPYKRRKLKQQAQREAALQSETGEDSPASASTIDTAPQQEG